jgi:hypothetical protein
MGNAVDRRANCTTEVTVRALISATRIGYTYRLHARLPGPSRGPGQLARYGEEESCLKRLRLVRGGPVEVGLRLGPDVAGDDLAE